jgi:hypothetical protein
MLELWIEGMSPGEFKVTEDVEDRFVQFLKQSSDPRAVLALEQYSKIKM